MKHIFFILALCASQVLPAQNIVSKVYGPGGTSQAEADYLALAADSGYFIGGSKGDPNGGGDMLIIRVNKNGDTLWTTGFGTSFPSGLSALVATSDGGCMAAGMTNLSFIQQNTAHLTAIRLSASGQILWTKYYSPPAIDAGSGSILALPDGSFLVTGNMRISSQYRYDSFVCRIDGQGNLIWSNLYRMPYPDDEGYGRAIISTDGNIILVGTMTGPGLPNAIGLITKIDTSGNVIWSKMITTSTSGFYGQDLSATADGGCVMMGLCISAQSLEIYAMRFDAAGDTAWTAHYGSPVNSEWPNSINPSPHGYILCGSTESFSPSIDAWLVEIDSLGQMLWSRAYGDGGWQEGKYAMVTPEGGYAVAGREQSSPGAYRYWFFKTDSAGIGGLCTEYATPAIQGFQPASINNVSLTVFPYGQDTVESLSVWHGVPVMSNCILTSVEEENPDVIAAFPNPAQDELQITGVPEGATVRVTDAVGKTVVIDATINAQLLSLNTTKLAAGIYIVSVTAADGKTFSQKFVIAR